MSRNKCHYVNDEIAGKVLIPYCWPVINSNDKRDCTCNDFPTTDYGFEKKRFNEILQKKDEYIALLEKENERLSKKLNKKQKNDQFIQHKH